MINTDNYINESKLHMDKAISHLESELSKVRAGKISPSMIEGIMVDYYGSPMPINQVGNITVQDARTLAIQPWEKNMLPVIEKAILAANIGITPANDGNIVRLITPPLTEERRKEFVKKVKEIAEHARVAIRNIRRDANDQIKKLSKEHVPEDAVKSAETKIQDNTNKYIALVDKHADSKEKEIMTV